jgi:hypothetical protein
METQYIFCAEVNEGSQSRQSKIWSWIPWYSETRITMLASTSSNLAVSKDFKKSNLNELNLALCVHTKTSKQCVACFRSSSHPVHSGQVNPRWAIMNIHINKWMFKKAISISMTFQRTTNVTINCITILSQRRKDIANPQTPEQNRPWLHDSREGHGEMDIQTNTNSLQ